jgi:hypothetical protein
MFGAQAMAELNSAIDWMDLVACVPILVLLDVDCLVFGLTRTLIQIMLLLDGAAV